MSKKQVLNVDTLHIAAVADDQTALSKEAIQAVFGQLAGSTAGYKDRASWEAGLRVLEDEYMVATQKNNPEAKTKDKPATKKKPAVDGRWKYRTYLPAAWSSSKSVCGGAMDASIKIDAESKKTATEKAIKEHKQASADPKTPQQKFSGMMISAYKLLEQLSSSERAEVMAEFGIDPNNSNWSN